MKGKLFVTGLAMLSVGSALAVKAIPEVLRYLQADGTEVNIRLHGDESFHFATDTEGRLIMLNDKGCYEYAEMSEEGKPRLSGVSLLHPASEVKGNLISADNYVKYAVSSGIDMKRRSLTATRASNTGSAKYRYSTSAFPTIGTPHSIVVLVEYPDYKFSMADPQEYYNDFLNGENFTRDKGTGSCRKYYSDNSKGQFVPTFDVYGPVMMKNARSYYGGGNEENASQMVVEAVKALDAKVDFSQYDHNDDGYVDSIYIIYAEKGEASGGAEDSVWPFSWELESQKINLYADGVKVNTYGCSNELQRNNQVDGIGTFTHEFGHVLGLPDLYNTVSTSDETTPWTWSLMDSGSYNNNSRTPPSLSSFERYSLGWLNPVEIVADGDYSLSYLADSNKAYIMTTEESSDEFFILEYRKKSGWDQYLPGKGMLIWHIDFVQSQWDRNTVNNNSRHHYVDLLRADNVADARTLGGDSFPGSKSVTLFSNTTTPALKSWAGKDLNVTSISNITETGSGVSFKAKVKEFRGDAGVGEIMEEDCITISNGTIYVERGSFPVYDISGRKIGEASEYNPLRVQRGIYIVNGKKYAI